MNWSGSRASTRDGEDQGAGGFTGTLVEFFDFMRDPAEVPVGRTTTYCAADQDVGRSICRHDGQVAGDGILPKAKLVVEARRAVPRGGRGGRSTTSTPDGASRLYAHSPDMKSMPTSHRSKRSPITRRSPLADRHRAELTGIPVRVTRGSTARSGRLGSLFGAVQGHGFYTDRIRIWSPRAEIYARSVSWSTRASTPGDGPRNRR